MVKVSNYFMAVVVLLVEEPVGIVWALHFTILDYISLSINRLPCHSRHN